MLDESARGDDIDRNRDFRLGNGAMSGSSFTYFDGYMDDFRITKGVARYTESFVLPGKLPTSMGARVITVEPTEPVQEDGNDADLS